MPNSQAVIPLPLGFVKAFLLPSADGRAILVDAGMANTVTRLQRQITDQGFAPAAISMILLTHAHLDHIGGVPAVKAWTQAPVAIGRLDAEVVRSGQQPPVRATSTMMRFLGRLVGQGSSPRFQPDLLVDEELDLGPYGVAGRVLHTPGHSPGSLSIWLESGEVVVGDLVGGGILTPRKPGYPMIVDDPEQLERSIAQVLNLHPQVIHASHGGPFVPEDVRGAFPRLAALPEDHGGGAGGASNDR